MAVIVELPADLEQRLRGNTPDLDAQAKETLLVELYRQEKLSHYELSQALGLDRFATDGVLKRHQVAIDLPTPEELEEDLRYLRTLVRQ
jgi:predicted HTH domain antitoxin